MRIIALSIILALNFMACGGKTGPQGPAGQDGASAPIPSPTSEPTTCDEQAVQYAECLLETPTDHDQRINRCKHLKPSPECESLE